GAILAFGAAALAAAVLACGLEDGGTLDSIYGHDGAVAVDSAVADSTPVDDHTVLPTDGDTDAGTTTHVDGGSDAGATTSYSCGATLVKNCRTDCPSAPYECRPTKACVANCFGGCGLSGAPSECNACGADGGLALSVCEPLTNAGACLPESPDLQRCTCATSSACTSDYDICLNGNCYECNDPDGGTSGQVCKGGTGLKKCDTSGGAGTGFCH
ncbi:MAG: hypothetical protein ABI551_07735, partial [Polyangiaceae bacterium]